MCTIGFITLLAGRIADSALDLKRGITSHRCTSYKAHHRSRGAYPYNVQKLVDQPRCLSHQQDKPMSALSILRADDLAIWSASYPPPFLALTKKPWIVVLHVVYADTTIFIFFANYSKNVPPRFPVLNQFFYAREGMAEISSLIHLFDQILEENNHANLH